MKKSKIPITGNAVYEIVCSDTSVPESLFVIYCDRNTIKLNKLHGLPSDMREMFGEVRTFASLLDHFVWPPPPSSVIFLLIWYPIFVAKSTKLGLGAAKII